MASTSSGGGGGQGLPMLDVPSSLNFIVPILRVANEIEPLNSRVAYLCRFHAFERARSSDANPSGRGVKQFKNYLLHTLTKDEEETQPELARSDPREIQKFYQNYYERYIKKGTVRRKPEEMAKHYQTASVLYDVLQNVVPKGKIDNKSVNYAREVEKMKQEAKEAERMKPHFAQYNILPLNVSDPTPPVMDLPEIKAAVNALRNLVGLPEHIVDHTALDVVHEANQTAAIPHEKEKERTVRDLLDWLGLAFGFQPGNVENQREHLILLLANIDSRSKHHLEAYSLLDNRTVNELMKKLFDNYISWCDYLHIDYNLRLTINGEAQQQELLHIGLYLLIWGEASNVRFMPECLCYIFHNAHYYGRTIFHGGAKYRSTGRGFVVYHAKFADNYRMYSRSHFVKGLELLILLVVYQVYGHSYRSSTLYLFVTFSLWFLVASWLFAPFIFNPSCFEWQKTVEDWTDWNKWMGNLGGIGISSDLSWESWWGDEQEHLKTTSIRGRLLEIILSLRFLIYQYGIVYHLNIAHESKSIVVYALSWLVMAMVLIVLKMVSMGRRKFRTDFQLMFRILKALFFLAFVSVMTVLFVVAALTISDVFASVLGFMPTGWCILLIGQACQPLTKKLGLWDSIKELGRAYDYVMGVLIFLPIAVLSWCPFTSEFQTRLLFNQAFSRGLQISRILAGRKESSFGT